MFVGASNTQAIFQPGKGEGVILRDMPGLEKGADKQLQIETEKAKLGTSLQSAPQIEAWDTDYYSYIDQLNAKRKEMSERLAKGEVNPMQAGVQYNNYLNQIAQEAKLTKEQEKVYLDGMKVLNDDKTGVYDRMLSEQNLAIYRDPKAFFDKVPWLRESYEAAGGNLARWRAGAGAQFATPELAYNFEKHSDDLFKDIKPITTGGSTVSGNVITTTTKTQADPSAAIQAHTNMVAQSLQGNFRAQRYLQTGMVAIESAVQVGEDGAVNFTPQGKALLKVMEQGMNMRTEQDGNKYVDVNGEKIQVTPDNIKDLMLMGWTIKNADAYVEKKDIATKKMNRNINIGGSTPKKELGLFTGLANQFNTWSTTTYPALMEQFDATTRQSDEFLNTFRNTVENQLNLKGKTIEQGGQKYMQFPITAKLNDPEKSQTENGNNLVWDFDDNKGVVNSTVTNIRRKSTSVMPGYYDAKTNRWKVADNKYLQSGKPTTMLVVNEFSIAEPNGYQERLKLSQSKKEAESKAKSTGRGGSVTPTDPPERFDLTADDLLYMEFLKKKRPVYAIYPASEQGVAQSLDKAYSIAGGIDANRQPEGGNTYNISISEPSYNDVFEQ